MQAVSSGLITLLDLCKKQEDCRTATRGLLEDMEPLVTIQDRLGMLERKSKSELRAIAVHTLELIADACAYIARETSRGALGKFTLKYILESC